MVASDHGPGHYSGPDRKAIANQMKVMEKQGHFSRGPWRGYKFSGYEGGLRVPFAAVWPGVIRPGTENDALVGLVDIMATWAGVAGVKLEPSHAPDSLSFLPYLENKEARRAQSPPCPGYEGGRLLRGQLEIDPRSGKRKLGPLLHGAKIRGRLERGLAQVRENPQKPSRNWKTTVFVQLYDLKVDPGETKNLAKTHFGQAQKMISAYTKIVEDGRTTPGPKLSNDRPLKDLPSTRLSYGKNNTTTILDFP